jgi:hypothetical protein
MDGISSISAIDQKMAEMRIKNLELLKRHQVRAWIYTNCLFGMYRRTNNKKPSE